MQGELSAKLTEGLSDKSFLSGTALEASPVQPVAEQPLELSRRSRYEVVGLRDCRIRTLSRGNSVKIKLFGVYVAQGSHILNDTL